VERGYSSRWVPEGSSLDELRASLEAYEVMRPKADNISDDYLGLLNKVPPPPRNSAGSAR
jgi:hypothetical protein